jgi:hypothetical protein
MHYLYSFWVHFPYKLDHSSIYSMNLAVLRLTLKKKALSFDLKWTTLIRPRGHVGSNKTGGNSERCPAAQTVDKKFRTACPHPTPPALVSVRTLGQNLGAPPPMPSAAPLHSALSCLLRGLALPFPRSYPMQARNPRAAAAAPPRIQPVMSRWWPEVAGDFWPGERTDSSSVLIAHVFICNPRYSFLLSAHPPSPSLS